MFLCVCVFVFLCFCVFVFLCVCVFVFLCVCVEWGGGISLCKLKSRNKEMKEPRKGEKKKKEKKKKKKPFQKVIKSIFCNSIYKNNIDLLFVPSPYVC